MKKCAYCNELLNKKNVIKTKEHVIPKGFIDLFPEQNIAFTDKKAYVDNNGFVVKDVCAECNNGYLSELDSYALSVVSKNFIKDFGEEDTFEFDFDFHKICRWLIKVAYNQTRMQKHSRDWFEKNIDYIKGDLNKIPKCSIFAGLHIDMCPIGEKNDLYYIPLSLNEDLKFYDNGLFKYDGLLKDNFIENSPLMIEGLYKSFFFRFGSIRFMLLIWNDVISESKIDENETLIELLFPYRVIKENKTVKLERVNDNFTTKFTNIIHGYVGINMYDEYMARKFPDLKESKKIIDEFISELPKFDELEELIINDYNDMIKNIKEKEKA